MVIQILADNFVMLFELAGLSILLRMSSHISPRMKRLTVLVITLLFTEAVAYEVEQWTQTFERLSLLRPMLTAYKYSVFPFILIAISQITANQEQAAWRKALTLAPAAVVVPIYFTSQWTRLVCYFSEENSYLGGLLPSLPYVVFGGYCVLFLIRNHVYFRQYSRTNRFAAFFIAFAALFGTGLYLLVLENENFGGIFSAAILLYYMLLYIHLAQIDPLTKLLNRQSFYQDLKLREHKITGVVSVDMNDLKVLNDTQGHEAGDTALKTVAACLRENCGRGGVAYRVGGDEFIILFFSTGGVLMEEAVQNIREALQKTPYACAFGSAMCPSIAALKDAIRESDRRMYVDKAAYKSARRGAQ